MLSQKHIAPDGPVPPGLVRQGSRFDAWSILLDTGA